MNTSQLFDCQFEAVSILLVLCFHSRKLLPHQRMRTSVLSSVVKNPIDLPPLSNTWSENIFSPSSLESRLSGSTLTWKCDFSPFSWAPEGTGSNEIKVRATSEVRREKRREVPALQTTDYHYKAAGEPRQPLVRRPRGIRYLQLNNDICTFCFSEKEKANLFGDHRGFDACRVIRRCSALPLLWHCTYYRFH